ARLAPGRRRGSVRAARDAGARGASRVSGGRWTAPRAPRRRDRARARPASRPGGGDDRPRAGARRGWGGASAPTLLGGRAPAQAGRHRARGAGAAHCRSVRGVIARSHGVLAAVLVVLAALAPDWSAAAPRPAARPATALVAGAAATDLAIPGGAPLAGYGGFPRRAWLPDVPPRFPYAFWFRPSPRGPRPPRAG